MKLNLRAPHVLLILMFAAYLLRLLLIVKGGQFYFPDESRYQRRSVSAVDSLFQADYRSALDKVLAYDKHHGFTAVALAPALFHRAIFHINPPAGLTWTTYWLNRDNDYRASALIFAMPSVLCIAMMYFLARRAGAGDAESLLAAFMLAACNSFFIFSKHFLPYDSSLLIGLTALWLAIGKRDSVLKQAMAVGSATFLCLWVYFGHVTFALMLALIYCAYLASNWRDALRRSLGMLLGALALALPLLLYNDFVLGVDILPALAEFSTSALQGEFAEGIVFPFYYFADSEAAVALIWALCLLASGRALWRRQWQTEKRQRALLWFACLLSLYLLLALFSSILQIAVVYGRIARTLAPFIILLSAFGMTPLLLKRGRKALLLFVAIVGICALANFVPAMRQDYFIEVARRARQEYGDLSYETLMSQQSPAIGVYGEAKPLLRYKLLNAGYYFPITELTDRPDGEVLMQVPHPFNHKPWQYEGMTPAMRDIINRDGLYIWLIDKGAPAEA